MPRYLLILIALVNPILSGCAESETTTSESTSSNSDAVPSSSAEKTSPPPTKDPEWATDKSDGDAKKTTGDTPPIEVALETVDETEYAAKLAELKGQVVFVDFWATWCLPCRTAFPHTVELAQRHASEGLAVVSVALDGEIAETRIIEFLEQQQAGFTNLRSTYGNEEPSFEKFEIGSSSLPHYKLYARDGTLVKTFSVSEDGTDIDPNEIAEAVRAELAK